MKLRIVLFVILLSGIFTALFTRSTSSLAATPAAIQGLHVSGNKILNTAGQTVRLLGVNRSGGEYMCVQGRGIWDGPMDPTAVQYMLAWKINAVRIPLNEDCWLGINGVNAAYAGATYQQAVVDAVNLFNSFGIVAILDLHWGAPGTTQATAQTPMPDVDHSPAFWQGVATTFKGNNSVIFDLFNEPYPDSNSDTTAGWTCWRDGGTCAGVTYTVAGMQSLVTTVRNTGATNIIMLGGLEYSNALSNWLTYMPTDPAGNLVASWHSYNFNLCNSATCWNSTVLPVLQKVPLIAGEIGENDCAHTYIDPLMTWLDTNGSNYLAWTWDAWGICASGPVLINDYYGNPTAFGQGFKDHLNTVVAGPTVTALPQPTVGPGVLQVSILNGNGDNSQQSSFRYTIANPTGWGVSNISVRIYFTLDGSNAASLYTLDNNYDSSGVATISGPTQASGNIYYFSVNYGTTLLGPGGSWIFQPSLHLTSWASTFDASNDWFHTGYPVGSLPASYTATNYIPAYVNGVLASGSEPSSNGTIIPSNTPTFVPPSATATNTPTKTNTSVTPTSTVTQTGITATSTVTLSSTPTSTVTQTGITATSTNSPTRTNTPTSTSGTVVSGGLKVRIENGGTDSTQQSQFNLQIVNTGSAAQSNITVRVYFALDGTQPVSKYVIEKYWDQSGVATISGPTLASGSVYFYTVNFGTSALAVGGSWQFNAALHLSDWSNNFDPSNDPFHAGYATGALPSAFTDTTHIPVYVNGTLTWGVTP
jgi:hypothetical protein